MAHSAQQFIIIVGLLGAVISLFVLLLTIAIGTEDDEQPKIKDVIISSIIYGIIAMLMVTVSMYICDHVSGGTHTYKYDKPVIMKPSEMSITYQPNGKTANFQIESDDDETTAPETLTFNSEHLYVNGSKQSSYPDIQATELIEIKVSKVKRVVIKYDNILKDKVVKPNPPEYKIELTTKTDKKAKEFAAKFE